MILLFLHCITLFQLNLDFGTTMMSLIFIVEFQYQGNQIMNSDEQLHSSLLKLIAQVKGFNSKLTRIGTLRSKLILSEN